MALSEQQIEDIIDYATGQIKSLVANYDIQTFESDKELQRMFVALSNLYDELDVVLSDYLPPSIFERYMQGVEQAQALLGAAGMGAVSLGSGGVQSIVQAPLHVEAISNIISDTMTDLAAATRTAKQYGIKELDKAFKEVQTEITNGLITGMTTKQMSKRVADKFGQRGMTSFVTVDGKHLPVDFYAKTVTRTKMQTAYNHGHLNRYEEQDVKHVEVSGNIPTCAECSVYRGVVFATSAGDDTFPHIDLHKTFPVHPNCRCNFRPYITKFKRKEDLEAAKEKARAFDPDTDARTKSEATKYDREQKAKQKARKQRLTFNKMQSKLGKDGPQSFKEFKSASKQQYHDWVAQMHKVDTTPSEENKEVEVIDYKALDYTTPDNFDDISNDYAHKIFDSMSDDEREAINAYTHDDYLEINKYTRDKTHGMLQSNEVEKYPEELGYIKAFAESLENMFDKYDVRLQDDVTLYRGVSEAEMADISRKIDFDDDEQMIYTLDNIKSVSSSRDEIDFFLGDGTGWTFEIKAPRDSRVLSVQNLSGLPSEREYLIQNGKQFEIANVDEVRRIVEVYLR